MVPLNDQLILEDLAQILDGSSSPKLARINVIRYLSVLDKPCPTSGCTHAPKECCFECYGYKTKRKMVRLRSEEDHLGKRRILDVSHDGAQIEASKREELGAIHSSRETKHEREAMETEEIESNPLVIPIFCFVFCRSDSQEKIICRNCVDEGFKYRAQFTGIYCHGCGFFVDYEKRAVGYSSEWTTSADLPITFERHCAHCGGSSVSAKFGDLWFCDTYCMQRWYFSLQKKQPSGFNLV